jgi:choline dehydrogenase-like flavoprotein
MTGVGGVPAGAEPVVEADVCIVGAGPVGITLARRLLGLGLVTCLVESGGEQPSRAADELARGTSLGEPVHAPEENTRRAFGGASHAWDIRTGLPVPHVRYMPFDEEDFEAHPWLPNSGWPFSRASLASYYAQAQEACGIGPFEGAVDRWEEPGATRLALETHGIRTAICQFGPSDVFHNRHREELRRAERSGQLRLLLHAAALCLQPAENGTTVREILCARPDASRLRVRARAFVLACGGFENPRLLLLSQDAGPAGLGNAHDVVGRYFHDHPLVFAGEFQPADAGLFARAALYDIRVVRGVPAMGYLALTPEARRRLQSFSLATFLFPRPEPRATHALEALRDGIRMAQGHGPMPIGPLKAAKLFARRPGVTLRGAAEALRGQPVLSGFKAGGWSRQRPPAGGWRSFHLWQQVEQSPDPANRVVLGTARDRFGRPLPAVLWRWSTEDDARVARTQNLLAEALRAARLGRLDPVRQDGRTALAYPAGAHHPMGATRMHADPRFGVVDADCRVHGVANLFIAGTSVLPTGGSANPTLTAIALALRLADHLSARLTADRPAAVGAPAP